MYNDAVPGVGFGKAIELVTCSDVNTRPLKTRLPDNAVGKTCGQRRTITILNPPHLVHGVPHIAEVSPADNRGTDRFGQEIDVELWRPR